MSSGTTATAATSPAAAALSTSSSASWNAIVAGAEKGGQLNIEGIDNDTVNQGMVAAFNKLYPQIKVSYQFLIGADLESRLQAEFANKLPGADVGDFVDLNWLNAQTKVPGFFTTPVGPNVTSSAAVAANLVLPGGKVIATLFAPQGYGYNTTVAGENMPFSEFVNPKFTGKVGLDDFCTNSAAAESYYLFPKLYGSNILQELPALKPSFYPDPNAGGQAMESGEIAEFLPFFPASIPSGAANIGTGYEQQIIGATYYTAILGNAHDPDAAQVWLNFLLSPQRLAARAQFSYNSVLPGNIPGATLASSRFNTLSTKANLSPSALTSWIEAAFPDLQPPVLLT